MDMAYDEKMQWYVVESEEMSHEKKMKRDDEEGGEKEEEECKEKKKGYLVYFSTTQNRWICECKSFMFSNLMKLHEDQEKREECEQVLRMLLGSKRATGRISLCRVPKPAIECKHIKAVKEYILNDNNNDDKKKKKKSPVPSY